MERGHSQENDGGIRVLQRKVLKQNRFLSCVVDYLIDRLIEIKYYIVVVKGANNSCKFVMSLIKFRRSKIQISGDKILI